MLLNTTQYWTSLNNQLHHITSILINIDLNLILIITKPKISSVSFVRGLWRDRHSWSWSSTRWPSHRRATPPPISALQRLQNPWWPVCTAYGSHWKRCHMCHMMSYESYVCFEYYIQHIHVYNIYIIHNVYLICPFWSSRCPSHVLFSFLHDYALTSAIARDAGLDSRAVSHFCPPFLLLVWIYAILSCTQRNVETQLLLRCR